MITSQTPMPPLIRQDKTALTPALTSRRRDEPETKVPSSELVLDVGGHRQCCDLTSNVAGRCQAADTHLTLTSPTLCHELPVEGSIFVPVPAWHLEQVDEIRPPICSHF